MVDVRTEPPPHTSAQPIDIHRLPSAPVTSILTPPEEPTYKHPNHLGVSTFSPVTKNGSFEFDRVIKSGYVQRRTQRTKTWKTIFLVLRPNALSIYKSEQEDRLQHKIYLSDLTAVAILKDPKNKRQNVFGLFSPAQNYHFQAPTMKDALEWVELIRKEARIEEEEEEMFLASPVVQRQSYIGFAAGSNSALSPPDPDRPVSSSPEPPDVSASTYPPMAGRPTQLDSSGLSGNELTSHSDFSDTDVHQSQGVPVKNLAVQPPFPLQVLSPERPVLGPRNSSQVSGVNVDQNDPDRVIWQGWLYFLRSKRGVRQWKDSWAVLRPRNLILYKDESEYSVLFIVYLSSILNVVDVDPISRSKFHCLQIITEEKTYRFCAHDEESLVQCLGAFKSLLAKRRELEAKAKANAAAATTVSITQTHPPVP
ncbi:hypothetical protein VTK73DRAFT_5884 [Phialemonium thermophilum]|uniref:PH domain-containing protein n=1 Tax=Phialemonium thermophilum TaxID=223376 RepID=A0ABR3XY67_9PEZI